MSPFYHRRFRLKAFLFLIKNKARFRIARKRVRSSSVMRGNATEES